MKIHIRKMNKYQKVSIKHKEKDRGELWHYGINTRGTVIKIIPENIVIDIKK